jgi:hypothetical protein
VLDLDTRTAILRLAREGHGAKTIARLVGVSRNTVKGVLRSGQAEVPPLVRVESLDAHIERVRELHVVCRGNLVRVLEELADEGVDVAYSTLTSFCRRHGIGTKPKSRPGSYHFGPGEEMQHDTSPHQVEVGGRLRTLQCASLVLCYSRKQYAQCYPRWTRFEVRVFLTEALQWMGGAAGRCLLDNSGVIIFSGTGKDAVPAPAMEALADRFDFTFMAYELGNKDRAGRVERGHHHVENNFYPGRTFTDLADLNRQLRTWCDKNFHRHRKRLRATPAELFVAEQPCLKPLPPYIPEVYDLHQRRGDIEGYVNLHTNRYSVDAALIGSDMEVRETVDLVRVFRGHRLVATHDKQEHGAGKKVTLEEHKGQTRRRRTPRPPTPQEALLRGQGPELAALIDALQKRYGGRAVKAVHRLHRLWCDYPLDAVRQAAATALTYGLLDLKRIERMVLLRVAGDFFRLPTNNDAEDDDDG